MAKRRADWLLGRMTAKAVVAAALKEAFACEGPLCAIEISNDPSGRPYARLAPEAEALCGFAPGVRLPISVSISHAEGHALCAAAFSWPLGGSPPRSLGIDLGRIEPRSAWFIDTFFCEDEQRLVRDVSPLQRSLLTNFVWCAKEAVLKALGLGLTVDTRDLCCLPESGVAQPSEWPMSPPGPPWQRFVARCGPAVVPGGMTIRGIWTSLPGFVGALTSAAVPSARERRFEAPAGNRSQLFRNS